MVGYADDLDFIGRDKQQLLNLESKLKDEFLNWNLKVNTDKTELIKISKSDKAWKTSKKLGSFLDDKKDIERRKQLAQTAMSKLWKIYKKGKKLKISKKVRVYDSYVKPVLTYNSSAWAVNKNIEAKVDAFHRKQIKRVIGIYYPNRISNKELYKKTNIIPLSVEITGARWRMLGHILRRPATPAFQAMKQYNATSKKKNFSGRP